MRSVMAASILRDVDIECRRIDVHVDRRRSHIADGGDSGVEGERNGDDFVARADSGREQRQMQRAGAGVDADRIVDIAIGRKLLFQPCDFVAENKLAALKHARHGGIDFGFQFVVFSAQIEKRNRFGHSLRLGRGCFPMEPRLACPRHSTTARAGR